MLLPINLFPRQQGDTPFPKQMNLGANPLSHVPTLGTNATGMDEWEELVAKKNTEDPAT